MVSLIMGICFTTGPVDPDSIFDSEIARKMKGILYIGDNFAGYMIGYQRRSDGWLFIGLDSCICEVETMNKTLSEFVKS